jgi:Mlc titration factor MtfA (ptsG expression regulator)
MAAPFPEPWYRFLHENLPFYRFLDDTEKAKLRNLVKVFLREKNWEGCNGLKMTDEIRVTISGQACLMVMNLEDRFFDQVKTVLVYPARFFVERREIDPDGTMHAPVQTRLGEAWYHGPVVLSWEDTLHGCLNPVDGINVVIHEFAHKLDMESGIIDGTPPLEGKEAYDRWHTVMTHEFDKLKRRSARGMATLLDQYGATHPSEFFAVCTECFFEQAVAFERRHPGLYALLRDYFRQDPAARIKRVMREGR